MPTYDDGGERISSTAVRTALETENARVMRRLLVVPGAAEPASPARVSMRASLRCRRLGCV